MTRIYAFQALLATIFTWGMTALGAGAVFLLGGVRQKLLELQRSLAAAHNVIMDGRDIGTCVLPDAQVKIYLTADPHVRALRRYKELEQKGQTCNLEEIEQDIKERDYRDMHREIAPLRQAPDALYVDSSHMTMEEVVRTIAEAAQRKRREMEAGQ